MKNKETLEEFVTYLKNKPSTYGYDAILAYDRFRANRLLLQEYIDRFDNNSYFEPLSFTTTITPGAQWEAVVDHTLDVPRLSFENSSIAHSRADLTMRITAGKQLTLTRSIGAKVKKLIRVKEADSLDGPALHVRISLDASPGSVSQAGTVSLDLQKAEHFYLSFADTDEENLIGGQRYKAIFDSWEPAKRIFVLTEMPMKDSDFLQPEKFWVRTHAALLAKVRASDQYGEGEVLLFVTMKGSNNSDAGIPADDENMHYLLPDAVTPYTMNLLLGNKFLIKRLVSFGFERLERVIEPFKATYTGGEGETFVTGIQATAGLLSIPVEGDTDVLEIIEFPQGLLLNFSSSSDEDDFTNFKVKASDETLDFEWFGLAKAPATFKVRSGSQQTRSGMVSYRWEYKASYAFHLETAGDNVGQLTLKLRAKPSLRSKMWPDQALAANAGHPFALELFINFGEQALAEHLEKTIETIVGVATEIDAFRLNGLLFRSGKESAQPSVVRFPGDLTLPGYLAPARTEFEIEPNETLVEAGGKRTFETTLGAGASVTWSVANLPGDEGEDCGSFTSNEYTAPAASAVLRSGKKVIVTATRGTSYSKALVSITSRSIAVAPMVMQAAAGGKFKLSAATLDGEKVTFTLPSDAKGSLQEDPQPDPSVQQSMLYVAPVGGLQQGTRKSDEWRRLRATAAWRIEDDLAEVLAIDTVNVSRESGNGQEQIPVLLPLRNETNWFTHHVEGNGIRLKFWGSGKGNDYEVPAEDTTWYLVLGNGTFEDGLYTPIANDGQPLSRYAVVAAIEDNRTFWLWTYAILPIPFLTPELLVEKLTAQDEDAALPGGSDNEK